MEKAHFILFKVYMSVGGCLWSSEALHPRARAGGGCKLPGGVLGTELYSPARRVSGQSS